MTARGWRLLSVVLNIVLPIRFAMVCLLNQSRGGPQDRLGWQDAAAIFFPENIYGLFTRMGVKTPGL